MFQKKLRIHSEVALDKDLRFMYTKGDKKVIYPPKTYQR